VVGILHARRNDFFVTALENNSNTFDMGQGSCALVDALSFTLTRRRLARRAVALVTRGLIHAGRIAWPDVAAVKILGASPNRHGQQFAIPSSSAWQKILCAEFGMKASGRFAYPPPFGRNRASRRHACDW
jgi:hypothetical protein